jgi:nucleotide-binding universal stress UspA family protein
MRFVVAMDLTDKDAAALERTVGLARSAGADVTLLNVFSPWLDMGHSTAPTTEERRAQVTAERQEYLRKKAESVQGVTFQTVVEQRRRAEEVDVCIARVAREQAADILVVASKRVSGLRGLILGSTALGLLRRSPCPVLVVRPV